MEHCDKFWFWLRSQKVISHRSGIVEAIAKRVNARIPGVWRN